MTHVVVVGAGIGGLTLASALTRLAPAIRVEVIERDQDVLSRAQGYNVALRHAEGMAVLRELDLAADVEQVSRSVPELRLLTPSGKMLHRFKPAGPESDRALTTVPRARLRELLLETLPPQTVSWNARAVGFTQDGEQAEARLEDGRVRAGDLVAACDGARSLARLQLFGERLRYVGLSRIGGVTDRFAHPRLEDGPFLTLGKGCSVFVHPLAHERLLWAFATRTAENELTHLSAEELRERATAATRGWHEPIPTLITSTDETDVDVRGLYDVAPPTRIRRGRIILLGDASHAMTPYRGRGANMAMLDAVELAHALARWDEGFEAALNGFEARMLPRNRKALNQSHGAARSMHPTSWAGVVARNARLRAARFRSA